MVLSMVVSIWLCQVPGCAKDTDCKGDRICEAGGCVAPSAGALPQAPPPVAPATDAAVPPPMPPSADSYPRVIRHDGLTCVQTLEADGHVEESCRRAGPAPRPRPLPAREVEDSPPARPDEPVSRFVASFLLRGGMLAGLASRASIVLPEVGGSIALGARFRSGVGVTGLGSLSVGVFPNGAFVIGTLAPALRFGDRSHFLLGLGPSVVAFSVTGGGSGSGVAGSLIAEGVFAVARAFALTIYSAIHVDASGVVFSLGAGFGFGAF